MEKHGQGLLPSPYDVRDYSLAYSAINYGDLPESFQLESIGIKDQGDKPTCAAHTISELIEYHNFIQNRIFLNFSTEFIYGARESDYYIGDGMYLREAMKIAQQKGDVLYEVLPGNSDVNEAMQKVQERKSELLSKAYPNRISTYYKIDSEKAMKYALMHDGPVAGGMKLYDHSDWNDKAVYIFNPTDSWSGHAVLVIGWTEDYWIIQNSWGYNWGDHGLFYIPITENFEDIFLEAYGATDNINEIIIPTKSSSCIKWFYPIINMFKNLKWIKK